MSFLLLTPDGEVRLLSEDTPFEDIQRIVSPKGKMVEVVSTVEAVGESRLNAYVDEEARIRGGSEVNLRASLIFGRELLGNVVVTGPYDQDAEVDTGVTQTQMDHVQSVTSVG